jgi:hypothetical protein
LNRRQFLLSSPLLFLRRQSTLDVPVRLEPRVPSAGLELVSFGFPLPPGLLDDPRLVAVLDESGREIEATVSPLEPWRRGGRDGSIRSVGVRTRLDFSGVDERRLLVRLGERAAHRAESFDLPESSRVRALLPAGWLCRSEVAGPQTPAADSGSFAAYDDLAARSFERSLAYLESTTYPHWLFDRTTCYYKLYVRTGEARYLDAAERAAEFVRDHTETTGPDAGSFTLKGPDLKYVYPRAMHLDYLLGGDPRSRAVGETMARFCLDRWDPVYRPETYRPVPPGADPEKDRAFWSPRHEAYGFLGVLHGWELTGDRIHWNKAKEYADALQEHQTSPRDGRPADGSWRQDWGLYDPSESRLPGATSAWMTAILLDPLFHYQTLTGDERVPEMVVRWCDFLDRRGLVPDGSRAYYVIDCFGSESVDDAPDPNEQGMERHDTELAYSFAMGIYFSKDPSQRARFRLRFDRLLAEATRLDLNRPPRCFNWALQSSSQLVYFLTRTP